MYRRQHTPWPLPYALHHCTLACTGGMCMYHRDAVRTQPRGVTWGSAREASRLNCHGCNLCFQVLLLVVVHEACCTAAMMRPSANERCSAKEEARRVWAVGSNTSVRGGLSHLCWPDSRPFKARAELHDAQCVCRHACMVPVLPAATRALGRCRELCHTCYDCSTVLESASCMCMGSMEHASGSS